MNIGVLAGFPEKTVPLAIAPAPPRVFPRRDYGVAAIMVGTGGSAL
jgi:hypothetical protein